MLVECVPNVSEGRRPEVVRAIADAVAAVPGARVLDVSMDASHHRAVLTVVAPPERAVDAAFAVVREAARLIDLRTHRGVHPRIGAADVVPFVPLEGVTMDDCVALARALGARVGAELGIPVYLYDRAATRPGNRHLADIRRGGFEGLAGAIASDPARAPDFGPARVHPTAGAVAVGARDFLVAYNVYLGDARNLPAAREVARAVRASSGGLPGVKALALEVDGQAQVSMNLVDLAATPLHVAHAAVEREARARGVEPTWSEIVGLAPERALLGAAADRLRLRADPASKVLERRLDAASGRAPLERVLADIASPDAAAGGGSAAALAGALAASCARLVASLPAPASAAPDGPLADLAAEAARLGAALLSLGAADAEAWDRLRRAMATHVGDDAPLQQALREATEAPLRVCAACADVAALAERVARAGAAHAAPDAAIAALLAEAACRGAADLVRFNAAAMRDPEAAARLREAARDHVARAVAHAACVREVVEARLG